MNAYISQLPNTISIFRLILAPCYLYACIYDIRLGIGIFIICAISDWLDGFVARRLELSTPLGALLDPLGDKAISWAALIVICQRIPIASIWLASTIIIIRDAFISTKRIREYNTRNSVGELAVSDLAKIKTCVLFVAQISLMLHLHHHNTLVYHAGSMLLYASSLLTLVSFGHYLKRSRVAERKITRE